MSSPKPEYDVFLSYSYEDRPWVSEFSSSLRDAGVQVWFDIEQIAPGDRWQEIIQDALRQSKTLVVILSSNSIDSPNMYFELGAAVAGHKRIIPVLLENIDLQRTPTLLRQFQSLQASSPTEAGRRVAEILEKSPTKNT